MCAGRHLESAQYSIQNREESSDSLRARFDTRDSSVCGGGLRHDGIDNCIGDTHRGNGWIEDADSDLMNDGMPRDFSESGPP
jgi:hypothetical protein